MAKLEFFPRTIGVRVYPELVAWLDKRGQAERLTMSGMARKILEEAARRDLEHKDVSDDA
jgi:hypothetical protein